MTLAGAVELPLLAAQVVGSILATWAGIRVVDDIKHLLAARSRRARQSS